VERNLVYDVSSEAIDLNVNPGVPALPYPWPEGATPTRILNNVFIADRDNEYLLRGIHAGSSESVNLPLFRDPLMTCIHRSRYGRDKAAKGEGNTNAAVTWTGYTPAVFERNVVVVDNSDAPSRDGWFGGRPCAGEKLPAKDESPHCTYDTNDNFFYSTVLRNVYFNKTA